MSEENKRAENSWVDYGELAKYVFCAWIAYRLGVTLPTAKKQVEKALHAEGKEYPGAMWYHVAEYIDKLQAGHLPFDLNEMRRADEESDETTGMVQ